MPNYQPKVYRKHGATEYTIDAGGRLNAASGSIVFPANLQRGHINLDIFSARALASAENIIGASVSATGGNLGNAIGGLLNANSTPTLSMLTTVSNQQPVLTWASGVVTQINWALSAPRDFNSATALTMHIIAHKASGGATDNKFDFRAWSGTSTDLGSTQSATLTSTPTAYSVNVTGMGGYPAAWTFGLAPIAHTNFANIVQRAWIEYDKRSS